MMQDPNMTVIEDIIIKATYDDLSVIMTSHIINLTLYKKNTIKFIVLPGMLLKFVLCLELKLTEKWTRSENL